VSKAVAPEIVRAHDWAALDARLRPFLRRRLPSAADVDDVMQEVLLKVLRGLPALADDAHLAPWMVQVARNAVADFYRRRSRTSEVSLPQPGAVEARVDVEGEEEREGLERMLAAYVRHLAEELPEPYREAIRLTELEGRTQREAAALLGVPTSTMKSRVQRGRERLRSGLEDCCRVGLDARGRVMSCEPRDSCIDSGRCGS
jgi:RNA polymerase sigma-70 factor (ECF subfamily)